MAFPTWRSAGGPALAAGLALSAAACATVEPPQTSAARPQSLVAAPPVRANAPIPNPPERAGRSSGGRAAVARALGGYRIGKPYQVAGVWYVPAEQPDYDAVGAASWYGDAFHGRPTANGELFDMNLASAAHATLPLPSVVEVTNLDNDRTIQVRVNDRGPFKPGRIIDVSREAADQLGFRAQGVARVRVRYVGRAPLDPVEPRPARPPERDLLLAAAPVRKPKRPEPTPTPIILASLRPGEATTTAPAFTIQAGSFANRGNAERAARTLGAIAPAEVRETQKDGAVLYRVLVGAWPAREGAAGALGAIAEAGFPDARVVSAS